MASGADGLFANVITLSDSGQVATFIHPSLQPGTYIYSVDAMLGWECGSRLYSNVAVDTVTILLPAPFFHDEGSGMDPCGNEITFGYNNPNPRSHTEVWRSRYPDKGFELVKVLAPGEQFLDQNLESSKTYYYQLRARTATAMSDFSEIGVFHSGYKWYDPIFELKLLPDSTVQGILVDRSYLDESYDVISGNSPAGFMTFTTLKDSGRVFTFVDDRVIKGQTYTYEVGAVIPCGNDNYLEGVASATITIPDGHPGELKPPTLQAAPSVLCGTFIRLIYENVNDGSGTEIWRSLAPDGGFELITVKEGRAGEYYDEGLAPKTSYYYKARAVTESDTSRFSRVLTRQSGEHWFNPILELSVSSGNTVVGKLTDGSYLDSRYEIWYQTRGVEFGPMTRLRINVVLSDSGKVFTFTHNPVEPGKTYIYYVHADLGQSCGGGTFGNVAVETISIPGDLGEELAPPWFRSAPPGYQACSNQIAFVTENPNEGAVTEIWRSRSPDSGFELITVQDGAFLDDNLGSRKVYNYKLRAVRGTDKSQFSEAVAFASGAKWFEPTLELTLLPDNTVQGTITDRSYLDAAYEVSWGSSPEGFFVSTNMSDSGRVFTFIDSTVVAGETYTYTVSAVLGMACGSQVLSGVADSTITIPSTTSVSSGGQSASVTVFPNPVVEDTRINISGAANDVASISLIDSHGRILFRTYEVLPAGGLLTNEMDLEKLKRGIYFLNVDVGEKRVTRRIIVD